MWVVSWGFAIAALALGWFADTGSEPLPGVFLSQAPPEVRAVFGSIGVTVALVYGPVSALILARRPHPVGVILAVHAVGSGIATFGVQWGSLGAEHPGLPLWGFFAFAAGWGYVPGTFMTAVLPLLITDDRLTTGRRLLIGSCVAAAAVTFAASLIQQSVPVPVNPFAIDIPWLQARLSDIYTVLTVVIVGESFLVCLLLARRWRGATGRARTGLGWLTLGHSFLTLSYLALVVPAGLAPPAWVVEFGLIAPVVGQVLYPAAILVVVLGQRLWGIELVVSRVTLWALSSIAGVSLYLLIVVVAPRWIPGAGGLWFLAPLVIAVAIQPMRRWLQRRIDQLIYGEGADPEALLTRLGDRLGEIEAGAAGLRELCEALRRVLRLGAVEVTSRASALSASTGRPAGAPARIELGNPSEPIGVLLVWPVEGQRLDRRSLSVLSDVAGLFAVAVRLAESHGSLERARADLVASRANERRSVRRELHDGLGPSLAGIGFGLAAAENLAARRPEKAGELLAELAEDLDRRIRDVRTLVDEVILSPVTGTSLEVAVRELAARFDSERLRVRSEVAETGPLPVEVQRALYFITAEALANAARHGGPSRIDVLIAWRSEEITVTVTDDGSGVAADAVPGVGMRSMSERAAELGGELQVRSADPGTRITAVIPARRPVADTEVC
ncbi:hypothetical protein BHE97_04120 [Aeromicrobium sp. PE09-221]|nr:hypothetical protein BHE97_04120 [Aeromicrobium sp. PE09-221]